jgi:flavin reductase (DIM6/NTAB) family NADH-FMN oxidoreductase RutF
VLTQRPFRDILGRFATGVVLVTTQTREGPVGMAFNSFTSVSLEPPLIALCAAYTSQTWPIIRAAGGFAVTVLGDQHQELCQAFSTRGAERFRNWDWAASRDGHPRPADGLAWLDCRISALHPAGDHELVVAEAVDGAVVGTGKPLIFHGGRFTELAS